jgi:hypothetical protein
LIRVTILAVRNHAYNKVKIPTLLNFVLALCLFSPYLVRAQRLEVAPDHVFMDELAVIRAKGLQPKERVSIQASLVDGAGQPWTSQADFTADAEGIIDVSKQAPIGGSYKEVSAMGLIWSMRPTAKNVTIYRPPANFGPQSIEFRLLKNGTKVASARLQQIRIAEDVQQIKLVCSLRPMGRSVILPYLSLGDLKAA